MSWEKINVSESMKLFIFKFLVWSTAKNKTKYIFKSLSLLLKEYFISVIECEDVLKV